MKHLCRIDEAFDKPFMLKKPEKLSVQVWRAIDRGLQSGIITDYKMENTDDASTVPNVGPLYNQKNMTLRVYKNIRVFFKDGTEAVIHLKLIDRGRSVRDKNTGQWKNAKNPEYRAIDTKELVDLLIKPNTAKLRQSVTDTIKDYQNVEHPKNEINELIKQSKVYQKLLAQGFVNVSTPTQTNRGTIRIVIPKPNIASYRGHGYGYTRNLEDYVIYKSGRVVIPNNLQPSFIRKPLESLTDYDECLTYILNLEITRKYSRADRMTKHLEWAEKRRHETILGLKDRLEKDPKRDPVNKDITDPTDFFN